MLIVVENIRSDLEMSEIDLLFTIIRVTYARDCETNIYLLHRISKFTQIYKFTRRAELTRLLRSRVLFLKYLAHEHKVRLGTNVERKVK